jgi:hypothetical protein
MKPTLNSTKNEVSGCKPVVVGEDHACYYGGFLCLNDCDGLVWVETQEVLAKIALAEVEV